MRKTIYFSIIIFSLLLVGTLGFFFFSNQSTEENQAIPLNVIDSEREPVLLKDPVYANGDLDVIFDDEIELYVLRFDLKSHPSVDFVKQVGAGNQVVMWYDINSVYALENALGNPEFIDQRTGQLVQREWRYVVWGNESYEEPVYTCETKTSVNGTAYEECSQTGTETKQREVWKEYNSKDLLKGKMRIGIEVEVKDNDYLDGIWMVGGKRIDRHAFWTEVLSVNEYSGFATASNTGTEIPATGMRINITNSSYDRIRIINITKYSTNTATRCSIEYINRTPLANATFSGDTCVFSGDGVVVDWNTEYYLLEHSLGSSYTASWESGGGYPIAGTLISWTNFLWTIGEQPTNHGSIIRVGVSADEQSGGLVIDLISPNNNTNFTTNTINLLANVNSSGAISIVNVSLLINGQINETNTSGLIGTYNFTKILSDNSYNWTVIAFGNDSVQYNAINGTLFFTVDTIFPQITISSPATGTNYPYLVQGNNLTLNVTIDDDNLATCFYEYNGTNTTFSCSDGVLSENNLILTNQSIVTVWANDTSGNLNNSVSDWTFTVFDFNNYIFDMNITEVSSTTFSGNFQTGTSISSTFFQYNNTNNSVSINSLGGNIYELNSTVTSPIVGTDTNISWFFWINGINTTNFTQLVININLDDCSSFSNPIAYYYLGDELTQGLINNSNSTIESLINLRGLNGNDVAQFNQIFTGNSTPQVCSEINLTSSNLRLWEQSRYGLTNYVFEQHNIQNASITSPANFTLLDLPSSSATTFRLIYKSETFLPVTDAVIDIQRKYIGEGAYKSAESPLTDANGEVSASMDLDSVIYRIIVRKNGEVLSTFENPAISCQNILTGDCTINLNERQSINLINNLDIENDFNYGLTQDNRTITLTFEIPSGTSKTVNLYVNQSTILGNNTACNQTLLATSGQLQCTIGDTLGDVFAKVIISSDGEILREASTTILEDRSQYFGTDNIILTFFLTLSIILLLISDPIAILFGIVIGLISSSLMLLLNSGTPFGAIPVLTYLIIVVIILIIKVAVRQNR